MKYIENENSFFICVKYDIDDKHDLRYIYIYLITLYDWDMFEN